MRSEKWVLSLTCNDYIFWIVFIEFCMVGMDVWIFTVLGLWLTHNSFPKALQVFYYPGSLSEVDVGISSLN